MFGGIRRRWAEARIEVAEKELEDLLRRFQAADPRSQDRMIDVFRSVGFGLERDLGPPGSWSDTTRKAVVKGLQDDVRKAFAVNANSVAGMMGRIDAIGVGILGIKLEAYGLPPELSPRVTAPIAAWEKRNSLR